MEDQGTGQILEAIKASISAQEKASERVERTVEGLATEVRDFARIVSKTRPHGNGERTSLPMIVAIVAVIAGLMALAGWVFRPEYTSRSLLSLFLAVVISAGTWGLVSWAIAAAAVEVTREEE